MKNLKPTSTEKLMDSFDNQLKNLLMADLKAFKEKYQFVNSNNQTVASTTLSAA